MNEPTPALSAPQTQTPRTDAAQIKALIRVRNNDGLTAVLIVVEEAAALELESAARQRVIEAIERECGISELMAGATLKKRILAIIADGKEGK